MRRVVVSVVLLVLLLFISTEPAFASEDWIPLNGSTSAQKPTAEVLSSNSNETVVRFTIDGFWSQEIIEEGIAYQALRFPDYATTLDVGKAQLPVISELIGVPGDAVVRVSVVDYTEVTLTGYNVYPFQTMLREPETRTTFDIDQAFYQRDAFYPEKLASAEAPGIWRDLRVVSLKVNPIRYNPATAELKACSEITVKLDYTSGSSVNVKGPLTRPVAPNYDRMYSSTVINYDGNMGLGMGEESGHDIGTDEEYDYLIIAADAYMSNMTPFVNWKNSQGLVTNIVPISSVGADVVSIRNYISDEYFTNGIRYVLLVGDESAIPGYTGYGFISDYYYALVDGGDNFADLAIGRFSVTTTTHVDNMVNKSITFESNPPGGDWMQKSLLVANWEDAPGKYQLCSEQIRTAAETQSGTYNILYPDFTTAYGASTSKGGDEASNADVINYINEGQRLVNYRGHGSENSWQYWNIYREYFELSDVADINNGQMTPVVFSIACLNNNLSYPVATIGEAFTRDNDAAVAYLSASDPSYTLPNHDYDKQLYAAVFDEGINAIGDASNESSVRTIDLWGNYGVDNARMYLWLGDPSLQLVAASFWADTTFGWIPLDVNFDVFCPFTVDSWVWDFGDGDSAFVQIPPTHTYDEGGMFDVTLQMDVSGNIYTVTRENYIVVVADTISGDTVSAPPDSKVEVRVNANNTIPVQSLIIPVEWVNDCGVTFDSFTTTGCRTDYFELQTYLHYDPWTYKRVTIRLVSSNIGTSPDLEPGSGLVAKLYFTVPPTASVGQSATIQLDGYDSYLPMYYGDIADYEVPSTPGLIQVGEGCCLNRGDIDHDGVVNPTDAVYFVNWLWRGGPEPPCLDEADVNGDNGVDPADCTYFVTFMWNGGPAPVPCP